MKKLKKKGSNLLIKLLFIYISKTSWELYHASTWTLVYHLTNSNETKRENSQIINILGWEQITVTQEPVAHDKRMEISTSLLGANRDTPRRELSIRNKFDITRETWSLKKCIRTYSVASSCNQNSLKIYIG